MCSLSSHPGLSTAEGGVGRFLLMLRFGLVLWLQRLFFQGFCGGGSQFLACLSF